MKKEEPKSVKPQMPELLFVEALNKAKMKSKLRFVCHDNCIVEIVPGEEEKVLNLIADIRKGVIQ